MELSSTNLVILGAFFLIIGLAVLIMPQLLPVLVALTLIVLGVISLFAGLTRRRPV